MVRISDLAMLAVFSTSASALPPRICVPPNKIDQANQYKYVDLTTNCGDSGHCGEGCDIFVTSNGCEKDDKAAIFEDLRSALTEQLGKDGFGETTELGDWFMAFDGFTTAVPDQGVSDLLFEGISNYEENNDMTPRTVYFEWSAADGGQNYGINGGYNGC